MEISGKKRTVGTLLTQRSEKDGTYKVYIPKDLPPTSPIDVSRFYDLLDKANRGLGELNGITNRLPDISIFLRMFMRKEALLSSQIEGTQSSLSEVLFFEIGNDLSTHNDEKEVLNYVSAMEYGLKEGRKRPLSLSLICEIHQILLSSGPGAEKSPGVFRTSQNWIGESRYTKIKDAIFVPPDPKSALDCFSKLEHFLHDRNVNLPILIKVALAHVQFETIHPFLDGNGRLGRLLITFMLCSEGVLKGPLLYLSLYLKKHKKHYYDLLQKVRLEGDWESWITFFLKGILETSQKAVETSEKIVSIFEEDATKIRALKKDTAGVLKIYEYFKSTPVSTIRDIVRKCSTTKSTAARSLQVLEEIGIIKETRRSGRNKRFIYSGYIDTLNEGIS